MIEGKIAFQHILIHTLVAGSSLGNAGEKTSLWGAFGGAVKSTFASLTRRKPGGSASAGPNVQFPPMAAELAQRIPPAASEKWTALSGQPQTPAAMAVSGPGGVSPPSAPGSAKENLPGALNEVTAEPEPKRWKGFKDGGNVFRKFLGFVSGGGANSS